MAFLFGVISDRMIKADKAWEIPFEVSRRLKHLSVTVSPKMAFSSRPTI
jgi:hypothetical protein